MWKDESVKQGERRKEELTDGPGFFFSFWLLIVSLEKKCSKQRKNLQMFDAVLLEVITTKASKRERERSIGYRKIGLFFCFDQERQMIM